MAQANVTINDQVFRVGCEEGEEQTLIDLADDINRRIETFRAEFGEVGNMRLLIMAALEIGDELTETRRRLAAAEAELADRDQASSTIEDRVAAAQQAVVDTLETMTLRVEGLTATINGQARN